jgi:D-sedoheptulose 7-phosphate isomerase
VVRMAAVGGIAGARIGVSGAALTGGRAAAGRGLQELLLARTEANRRFFEAEATRLAQLCHLMAERFARGGRLIACGTTPAARSDARHVAVEFVHPVIVGKRALPAIAVPVDDLELLCGTEDIVMLFGALGARETEAVAAVRALGTLTVSFAPAGADWEFATQSADPFVSQELIETLYHVLWELVHVFFEHRGLLTGRAERRGHDAGASSFLYPFLAEREDNLDQVLDDVRASVLMKAEEVGELRTQTLTENGETLVSAAAAIQRSLERGGTLLALGNGGSATDAMDVVADFRAAEHRAIDLADDPAIITALANDIGTDAIFSRQVIAYGHDGDVLLAFSTSGGSGNVIEALAEARRRGLVTIALVGYDGGRITAERLADHVIVTRSQHIPRIQEAQASAYHVLRELV